MVDTIFARSSGLPPAALGIVRVSGPSAASAVEALAGALPTPRRAVLRDLTWQGLLLDQAIVLWFPGPASATGEDCAEFHCHGGRAVLRAVEDALADQPGLRAAVAGEFTRRAFLNGRMDLAEAEGLADLLSAETEWQRRAAMESAGGRLSREVEGWRERLLALSAQLEALLDFSDEGDVDSLESAWVEIKAGLAADIDRALARPPAEKLRDGIRVVLAGPPNAGKSSLFNALLDESAAIVTPEAGTTRDALERSVAFAGIPFVLIDTAGIRSEGAGAIEQIGIAKAEAHIAAADIVLWLGPEDRGPQGAIEVAPMADLGEGDRKSIGVPVSAHSGSGVSALVDRIVAEAQTLVPMSALPSFNLRQRSLLAEASAHLRTDSNDALIVAEELRLSRLAFDSITGRATTEDMLDALFGRFCIGK